ncbi:uncharacterized protein VTP21DRAFT_1332 [Calcarisporiella thermophila]|uniref:uncharacterized protein n=1 Tax=Calcarisporiella thermophila TaxID=911321 RepID=UPI003744421B
MDQFLAGLDGLLNELVFSNDNEKLKNATATLNAQYYNSPNCVPALVEIVQRSPHWQVRQLAAVELRKRNSKWWSNVDTATQDGIKSKLLEVVMQEPNDLARHTIARVISSVAKIELPEGRWTELLQFLYQCCASTTAGHREVGIYVLFTLFEVVPEIFTAHTQQLFELFGRMLNDGESKIVRVTTLQALSKLAEYIEEDNKAEAKMFRDLVPSMVTVLQQCIAEGDENGAEKGFELFDNCLMLEAPLLSDHLAQLIEFFLNVASNQQCDDSIRVMALSFMMWIPIYKKSKLRSLKLVTPIIQRILPIGAEDEPEDIEEDSPARLAFKVLNSISTNLPPQQVFPTVMEHVVSYMQNPDPKFRKAAMMAFMVMVDGCADYMRPKFNELLPLVCAGLQDPEIIVRRAACMALGSIAEELGEEIASHHATLLPLVFNLMNDTHPEMVKTSCNALDSILEGMGEDIVEYLPALMEKLGILLEHGQHETRVTVVGALGSAAHAAEEKFVPYFPQVIARLQQLMALKGSQDELLLRGIVTDTVGAVAEAVGAEVFRPYFAPLMQLALEGMQLDESRLRECSYCFFAIMARVFEDEFSPYLDTIVPQLLQSLQKNEMDSLEAAVEGAEDDEDIDEDEAANALNVSSAIANEKEMAADAIGEIFEHTRGSFLNYVEPCANELVKLMDHYDDAVRKAGVGALFQFAKTFYSMSSPAPWEAGLPLKVAVHENVASMIKIVTPAILHCLEEEEDKMVVVQICQEFASILKLVGPCIVAEHVDTLCNLVLAILEKKAPCQQDEGEDVLDEDEQAEHDAMVISGAADVIGALALALGPNFADYFKVFFPLIAKYYKKSKSPSDRSMSIGCLSECCAGLKTAITDFTEELLRLFQTALRDEEEEVRSNAAYGTGVLCLHSQVDLSPQYPALLHALHPLFHGQTLPNVTDNACGAVCRMISARPDAVPLDDVLPVLVGQLPLKRDFAENEPVYRCIFQLFQAQNSWVNQNVPAFLHVFEQVLDAEEQLTPVTRELMIELVRFIHRQMPQLNIAQSGLAKYL